MAAQPSVTPAAPTPATAAGHVVALDGYRGVAVGLVVAHHLAVKLPEGLPTPLARLAENGWLGVDLFFALSGFLITGILLRTREHPRYGWNFLVRRVLRIIPLYYGLLLLMVVPGALLGRPLPFPLWTGFAFLTNFWLAHAPDVDLGLVVLWSLAVEEQFYAVWPWGVRFLPGRALLAAIALTLVGAPLLRWWYLPEIPTAPYFYTWCRMDALGYGALAAWLLHRGHTSLAIACGRVAPIVAVAGVLAITAVTWERTSPAFATAGYTVTAIAATVLILGLVGAPEGPLARTLRWRPLVHVGKVSFGLYLLHNWVIVALTHGLGDRLAAWGPAGTATGWALATALSVGAATLVFRVVEAPILTWKDRLAPYGRPKTPEPDLRAS